MIATKPKDGLLRRFDGLSVIREWPPPVWSNGFILWPRIERVEDVEAQRDTVRRCLEDVYRQGGWALYLDEARYVTGFLGLSKLVELLWIQGRSLGVSVVAAAQRPRHLPLAAYSQASHLFVWPTRDRQDLRRLQEMAGGPSLSEIEAAMSGLPEHACLYLGRGGKMMATLVEDGG